MRPNVSGTECVGFLKQDARGNLVVASLPLNFPFSEFCGRCLLWTSVGLNRIHTFLLHKNPWADTFLHLPSYAVQPGYGITKGYPNSWIGLIVACFMTASSRFAQCNSAGLPCYECFAVGLSTYLCHMAFIACLMTASLRFAPRQ
jgi:hypothetical protein